MKKILNIGWKDLIVLFQDRGALVLMLGAPLVLTIGLGLATGAFSDNDSGSGLADIPLVIVNLDQGQMGEALVEVFNSEDVASFVAPTTAVTIAAARQQVDNNEVAAAVIIPGGFSDSIIPNSESGLTATAVAIEVYANPGRPISAAVIRSIVDEYVNRIETGRVTVGVTMTQLVSHGRISAQDNEALVATSTNITERLFNGQTAEANEIIVIRKETAVATQSFNLLAYLAPAMAVLFLMYTVSVGGRSILVERDAGTLARLLVSPSSTTQIMGGKVFGIFLTGATQVSILIITCSLLFGLRWGNPLGVVLLIITVSAAATGWGLLLAAVSRTPAQINSMGTALMLTFGILGGSFGPLATSPFMQTVSKITPNAWAIAGFSQLGNGGTMSDIIPSLIALTLMAAILFAVAVNLFRRRSGSLI